MKQYRIQWKYKSSLGGPWAAGEEVRLPEELAAAIDRDSPGVLTPVEPAPEAMLLAEVEPEEKEGEALVPAEAGGEMGQEPEEISQGEPEAPEARVMDEPALDRMVKRARGKRGS